MFAKELLRVFKACRVRLDKDVVLRFKGCCDNRVEAAAGADFEHTFSAKEHWREAKRTVKGNSAVGMFLHVRNVLADRRDLVLLVKLYEVIHVQPLRRDGVPKCRYFAGDGDSGQAELFT